jgi:predicted nucleotidyltransferase component of viral defense system
MDSAIRTAQKEILRVFSKTAGNFALAGGTALELFYLHHRFSVDLDFFSPTYSISEIERLVAAAFKVRFCGGCSVQEAGHPEKGRNPGLQRREHLFSDDLGDFRHPACSG